jgi:hypothetical protein
LSNVSQRFVAALSQLSQFHYVLGDKSTLIHILSGVQVTADSDRQDSADSGILRLTFSGGHSVQVVASHYFELMLSEDAAHEMHAAGGGTGEIHKRAKQNWEHYARKYDLMD